MNYDLDMPPYIQEMADWLEDERKVHSCNFASAYAGFEIMMALCRSAVDGGQVRLPLTTAENEIEMLKAYLAGRKVMPSTGANAKEYLPAQEKLAGVSS
jgi:hypothetical protein